ncbi:MAG: sulfurtransferase, partial [Gammaproteobacteria bacterium]|nr:sulfurtransferase [Gammaproteobacteria bacterium]
MHPLIAPADLATHLDDPDWAIFDCRHQLTDPGHGRRAYAAGHIPGARFADTEADLCGPIAPETGRHPLPPWERFCTWLGEQGVDGQCTVVAYDDATGAIAARLWWMLRVLGHTRVAVLDGGFARWGSAGLPQQQAAPRPTPRVYVAEPDRSQWLELAEVEDGLGQGGTLLVDARTA